MLRKLINKTNNRWLEWRYESLARKNNFEPENVLIISGDPRGGTTWLSHLIREIQGTALIWEPLMVSGVKELTKLEFHWRQYIPEQDHWPEARALFERIFRGQLLSTYLCQQTNLKSVQQATFLLVKFCRANQLLPWLTREFTFRFSPIYLVRHPCAVVASQMKQGGWNDIRPNFSIPEGRYKEFYANHADFLSQIDTIEKRLATVWCLCNLVPHHHPENNKRWITITYESLLLNGEAELKRIEKKWGLSFPEQSYNRLKDASFTTIATSPIKDGRIDEQLTYWQKQLSPRQIDNVLKVLDYFKISLYSDDPLPMQSFVD